MAIETRERTAYRNPDPQETMSVVPKAEPIEVFSQVKKTPKMLEVEWVIQEDIREFIETKYVVMCLSQEDICRSITSISNGNIQLTSQSITNWMRRLNILARSSSEGAILAWQNPQKRERRTEGMHSPMAKREKSKSISENWQSLSESEKRDRGRAVSEGRRRALLRRMEEVLGDDPTQRLKEMRSRLSFREIGEELGKDR